MHRACLPPGFAVVLEALQKSLCENPAGTQCCLYEANNANFILYFYQNFAPLELSLP